jgi:hypothetical protein
LREGEKVDERKGKAPLKIAFCIQISSLPAAAVILWLFFLLPPLSPPPPDEC